MIGKCCKWRSTTIQIGNVRHARQEKGRWNERLRWCQGAVVVVLIGVGQWHMRARTKSGSMMIPQLCRLRVHRKCIRLLLLILLMLFTVILLHAVLGQKILSSK